MGETVSTKILLIPWTLITILIISLRHFLNGISRDETFKLCDENAQQHGLMSRLYPGSTSILWRELLKIPVSSSCSNVSLSANTVSTLQAQHKYSEKTRDTIEKYILLKCFIAGWDFNSCFMIRALNSQLVPGIPHHLYQQHHHQHYHRDWADWRLAMSGNLPIAIHWSQIWRKKKHNKRKKERKKKGRIC